jgi:hypothetical protein
MDEELDEEASFAFPVLDPTCDAADEHQIMDKLASTVEASDLWVQTSIETAVETEQAVPVKRQHMVTTDPRDATVTGRTMCNHAPESVPRVVAKSNENTKAAPASSAGGNVCKLPDHRSVLGSQALSINRPRYLGF